MPKESICGSCGFLDIGNPAEPCTRGSTPVNGYCENYLEKLPSNNPLDIQIGGGHYKNFKIQPVEFCQVNQLNFCESNVIKYVTRHRSKNGVQDINKAIHYLELIKEIEYGNCI